MTATTRWSYSRGSTFIALTVLSYIFFNGMESRSSSFSDKRSVFSSPFVRRDANTTLSRGNSSASISNSSSTTTASQTPNATTTLLSTQSSSTITPSSASTSDTSHSTTITSSSSRSLSISTSLVVRTTTLVVTNTSTSTERSSSSTFLVDPTPSVTFILTGNILSTSIDPSVSPTLSPVAAAASSSSSSGFWKNKAAITAVFVVVGLVTCGVIGIFIIAFFKRRRARERRLHDQLFDHYTDSSPTHSPGPSISSVPMDAFATREVGQESPLFFQVATTQAPQVMASSPVQHPNYDNTQPPSRYIPPSLSKTATSGPPVTFHNRAKRDSAQPSIDSFYGASAQPSNYKDHIL